MDCAPILPSGLLRLQLIGPRGAELRAGVLSQLAPHAADQSVQLQQYYRDLYPKLGELHQNSAIFAPDRELGLLCRPLACVLRDTTRELKGSKESNVQGQQSAPSSRPRR